GEGGGRRLASSRLFAGAARSDDLHDAATTAPCSTASVAPPFTPRPCPMARHRASPARSFPAGPLLPRVVFRAVRNQTAAFPRVPRQATRHGRHTSCRARPPPAAAHHHHHQQRQPFQPPARTTTTPLESVGSTQCAARMDEYMDALNDALERCQHQETSSPTSQHLKIMCFANLGWKLAAMLLPTQASGGKPFG
ncbi:unnamed protein product, partial [Urochloa humidicola]